MIKETIKIHMQQIKVEECFLDETYACIRILQNMKHGLLLWAMQG
jgi:hypothetical protein